MERLHAGDPLLSHLGLPGGLVGKGADLEDVLVLVLRVQPRGGDLPRRAVPPEGAASHGNGDGAARLKEEAVVGLEQGQCEPRECYKQN